MTSVELSYLPFVLMAIFGGLSTKVTGGIEGTKFETFAPGGEVRCILVLVPGYNGNGLDMLDDRWRAFAARNKLVLLAPTFIAEGMENNQGRGYYYPEQGSGRVMVRALESVSKRYGVRAEKVLMFGFSAGAHFTHRFAIWKPERVAAFVAYSAGWWSLPVGRVKKVPALIMCGEDDPRYEASFGFFKRGQALGCPWVWKSFGDTGHVLSGPIRDLAEVFLKHYARELLQRGNGRDMPAAIYGDVQTFRRTEAKEAVGEDSRILLPSLEVAEEWEKVVGEP